jgi:hypothetical protein
MTDIAIAGAVRTAIGKGARRMGVAPTVER